MGELDLWHMWETMGYVAKAVAFIEQCQRNDPGRPFFLYVPYTAVHLPIDEPKEWLDVYAGEKNAAKQYYGACVSHMDDGAALRVGDRWLIVTTDSHVIHPVFFPGGDIGRLAVSGTVNDLAMMGATEVLALTCAVIMEEPVLLCLLTS